MKRLLPALLWTTLALAPMLALGQFDHQHSAWTSLLRKHVVLSDGGKASYVRYAEFAKDRGALKSYLEALSSVSQQAFNGWSRAQQIAFLINAYNAYTVEKILTRYPNIRSIWDFGRVFGNPFRDQFFVRYANLLADDPAQQKVIRDQKAEIRHLDYDWRLNDARKYQPSAGEHSRSRIEAAYHGSIRPHSSAFNPD